MIELFKEDYQKELDVNKMARDSHEKGFAILTEVCKFYEKMVETASEKPVEEDLEIDKE